MKYKIKCKNCCKLTLNNKFCSNSCRFKYWKKYKIGAFYDKSSWNKGLTKDTDIRVKKAGRNISKALEGRKLSEEHKQNVSKGSLGKSKSEEAKQHMRKSRSEKAKQNMRKSKSEKHKQHMRDNAKININYGMKNKNHSKETKQNMRISAIKYIKETCGGIRPNIGRNEKHFLDEIELSNNIKIRRDKWTCGYKLDGYCEELNLAIEVDEKVHFDFDGNLRPKDIERQKSIEQKLGCKFLRIRDSDLFSDNTKKIRKI